MPVVNELEWHTERQWRYQSLTDNSPHPDPGTASAFAEPPRLLRDSGQEITFDASVSYSPASTIVKCDWDFNGDGTYESIGIEPVARHIYAHAVQPGRRLRPAWVTVQVLAGGKDSGDGVMPSLDDQIWYLDFTAV